jgi:hypothetical protein
MPIPTPAAGHRAACPANPLGGDTPPAASAPFPQVRPPVGPIKIVGDGEHADSRCGRGPSARFPRSERTLTEMATCPRGDTTWTGHRPCHCGSCHETFSGIRLFDAHRHHRGDHGGCLDPATLPGMERRDGMWREPEMSPEAKTELRSR